MSTLHKFFVGLACVFLFASPVHAQPGMGIMLEEADGNPTGFVYKLKVSSPDINLPSNFSALQ